MELKCIVCLDKANIMTAVGSMCEKCYRDCTISERGGMSVVKMMRRKNEAEKGEKG